ncbi:hypothetical protein [Brumimicrobium salinarum]|nr:hypothetical protein [Brumimicrobium salinarum]
MKIALIVLILLLFSFKSSCQDTLSSQEMLQVFKQINKSDASKLRHPEKREEIFLTNFKEIKELIEYQGLVIDSNFSKKRHIKLAESAIRMTFTHILQSNPSLILNEKFIELIREKLQTKKFCKDYLIFPLSVYVYENEIKSPFEGVLKDAMRIWGINESELIHKDL